MFEIVIPFYMAITVLIGWAIYSPFVGAGSSQEQSFAKIQLSDLFAVFLPTGVVLALATSAVPNEKMTFIGTMIVIAGTSFLALAGLLVGLFLLARMSKITVVKRMTMIGILIPASLPLILAWGLLPIYAFAVSIHLMIPATLAIAISTYFLRLISVWICNNTIDTQSRF